jgi:putative drug exporter of the RND superfamily
MATFLHRLGRGCFRRRGLVVALWLLCLTAMIGGAVALGTKAPGAITVPGTEAQRAIDLLREDLPAAGGAAGTIVVEAREGRLTDPPRRRDLDAVVRAAGDLPGVVAAVDPVRAGAISRDGRHALVSVQYARAGDQLTEQERHAYETFGQGAPQVLTVVPGGEPLNAPPEVGATEGIGVAVALLVLLLTFGSLVAAGMTMLNALVGVSLGMAGITMLGHVVDMTDATPTLALMLGLAVGIDYSLFITSRYRHNLSLGLPAEEAAGRAVGTAGSAVVFAGLTVIIALAGLSVVGVPFLAVMGLMAAATVGVAVLVALTLLPALLSFVGERVLARRQRRVLAQGRHDDLEDDVHNRGFRWGRHVVAHRIPALLLGAAVLGVLAVPAMSMRMALPDDGTAPAGTGKRLAYDMVTEGFGEGFNGRLLMVVRSQDRATTGAVTQQATRVAAGTEGVVAATPGGLSDDGLTAVAGVVPATGPSEEATVDTVERLREELAALEDRTGVEIAVSGFTAVAIDTSVKLRQALPLYLAVVVGLSFVLLTAVFRSLLVPLKATAGFLLSIGATFGVTVAVFQWGWASELVGVDTPGPIVSFLPIMMIGILFGLAMDYEVFLVSRMREDHVHGETAQEAVVSGVGHGARVVVAAALIMTSVFAGFVLVDDTVIKSIGFALAVGVLLDAFVVRLLMVPAAMSLLDERAWGLPGWLDRLVPEVDIEGESLRGEPEAPHELVPTERA